LLINTEDKALWPVEDLRADKVALIYCGGSEMLVKFVKERGKRRSWPTSPGDQDRPDAGGTLY
jgi:hypothetical protein